ncbi:MAG TPA: hypothetical protein LFV90_05680 [Rickettsia endosymbiont of Columbicola hoogstraali]|nr:hypothetical protein [Rickettsia endosymbiont of Columbicola hoogstraali]
MLVLFALLHQDKYRYCYVDSTDKIYDKFKVIKTLQNHKQQKFTAHEMAQLLLGTNSR